MEISLWILRIFGSLLFIGWPVVFVAASMLVLGHSSSETLLTLIGRLVGVALMAYPIFFILFWVWANKFKTRQPILALALTALPAVMGYVLIGRNILR